MASEPQPSNVHEGADVDGPPVPTNAEDRKAAAAMSTLEGRGDEDEGKGKDVDADALGKAMKSLNVGDGEAKKAEKKVKVEAIDVTLLVSYTNVVKVFMLMVCRLSNWNCRKSRLRSC
jgi:hypothetical protein